MNLPNQLKRAARLLLAFALGPALLLLSGVCAATDTLQPRVVALIPPGEHCIAIAASGRDSLLAALIESSQEGTKPKVELLVFDLTDTKRRTQIPLPQPLAGQRLGIAMLIWESCVVIQDEWHARLYLVNPATGRTTTFSKITAFAPLPAGRSESKLLLAQATTGGTRIALVGQRGPTWDITHLASVPESLFRFTINQEEGIIFGLCLTGKEKVSLFAWDLKTKKYKTKVPLIWSLRELSGLMNRVVLSPTEKKVIIGPMLTISSEDELAEKKEGIQVWCLTGKEWQKVAEISALSLVDLSPRYVSARLIAIKHFDVTKQYLSVLNVATCREEKRYHLRIPDTALFCAVEEPKLEAFFLYANIVGECLCRVRLEQ